MRTGWKALALAALLGLAPMAARAQISDDVVRIGVMNDPGGPYGDIGGQGSIVAARLAAEDFGGKVLGKRIEIIGADHQNRPDVATTTARRWYDTDRVDVIADGAASSTALAIQEVAREKHR
ncbi:MAG: ABC transporter substrate-binding protein, partial [Acetobacteraceae bacterium]|nr:ABC transporter substrate-binding protein [Acetobacteraceae bacterium]